MLQEQRSMIGFVVEKGHYSHTTIVIGEVNDLASVLIP